MFRAFSGSAVPKRLLRHALSRLDFLDTDAIDIDNLDLAIGRNTVLEFRDVGLRLEKLERILQLPPALQIRKARVRLLKVSIPIDFYTSPICVSVQAIEVSVSLADEPIYTPQDATDTAAHRGQNESPLVPNAADLAQSFLDMQSLTEKRELEQALSKKSSPSALPGRGADGHGEGNGDGEDDESGGETQYGTGQPLSLPGFLASFLQGIVDRVEVTISDVTFKFDINLPTNDNHYNNTVSQPTETISFVLQLDSIEIEGVTSSASTTSKLSNSNDSNNQSPSPSLHSQPLKRQGKRHVAINNLHAYLVSDPRVFSLFTAPSPAPSSVQSGALPRDADLPTTLAPHSYHGEDFLTGSPAASNYSLGHDPQSRLQPALDLSPDQIPDEDPATPRQSLTNLFEHSAISSTESLPPFLDLSTTDQSPARVMDASGRTPTINSQPPLPDSIHLLIHDSDEDIGSHNLPSFSRSSSSSDVDEDLTTSRMFTHSDAESLYMSAISLPQPVVPEHEPPSVLLRADIKDIAAKMRQEQDKEKFDLSLGNVSFGYANEHIVWFEHETKLQASSMQDSSYNESADIQVSLSQNAVESRVMVVTLPLYAKLNLGKLDEFFDHFGGVSEFADMGLSMISQLPSRHQPETRTKFQPRERSASATTPKMRPRGVRFDETDNKDKASPSGPKVDFRIGGCRLRLVSQICRFDVDTTLIKAVVRNEGIGAYISQIQITGPWTHETQSVPMTLQLNDTRIDFLGKPLESDISRLLEMLMPAKSKFKDDNDLMVDRLFAQRRKGSLLRVKTKSVQLRLGSLALLKCLSDLGDEVGKLAPLALMFPEDDRPGILVLAGVEETQMSADVGGKLGIFHCDLRRLEVAHVGFPSLLSVGVGTIRVDRNGKEVLVDSVRGIAVPSTLSPESSVAVRVRMIGDDFEPVIRVRVQDLAIEYRVPMMMDLLGLEEDATPQEFEETLAASVANLGETAVTGLGIEMAPATNSKGKTKAAKPLVIDLALRDTLIGFNPLGIPAKMYAVLGESYLTTTLPENGNFDVKVNVAKAWLMLVDDVEVLTAIEDTMACHNDHAESLLTAGLSKRGFANISYISSSVTTVKSAMLPESDSRQILIDTQKTLFILETCADSTQTLIALANALSPPTPPSTEIKYRTAMEVQDLLASISGDAFGQAEGDYDFENDFGHASSYESGDSDYDNMSSLASSTADLRAGLTENYGGDSGSPGLIGPSMRGEKLFDVASMTDSITTTQDTRDGVLLGHKNGDSFSQEEPYGISSELVFDENYFEHKTEVAENARLWDAAKGSYAVAPKSLVDASPVKITVREVSVFWKLFDGYDWAATRDVISEAVLGVQKKAMEHKGHDAAHGRNVDSAVSATEGSKSGMDSDGEDLLETDTEIGDFLFNSIYIGITPRQDPHELTNAINRELGGDTGDTESIATATTQTSASTIRPGNSERGVPRESRSAQHQRHQQKLRLQRSKKHKIAFEAVDIHVDIAMLPAGSGPTQSCIDVRVKSLDVIDHMPQSSWRKFATYDRDAGERELDSNMIHLEVLNVKPVADLAASEFVISVEVLPLRLHVDQDALDFITRFFAFKDERTPIHQSSGDVPFVSRFEIQRIPLKLDFKPRHVDYVALRSGKTSEFMNFVTLQDTHIELRRVMLHGVTGFDRVGLMLNDLWTPDVKRFQLATVLAGLSFVRPLADVGSGVKDLIEIPMAEYRKDGRILRSIKKGAMSFVRNTGTGVVKLGAKVAVGTQNALEGAEGLLSNNGQKQQQFAKTSSGNIGNYTANDDRRVISPYANQPLGVVQGLRGGYTSLTRDITMARDAIVAVSTQVMESNGPAGAARAVLEAAPTIIFRPAIGASKAIGQTLLGVTNTLDPVNRRRIDDKYK
ncbi:Autophagy-related protein 2 [Ceratocystis platani]|uniref:Autophagy-related protein 2 n=1 Tax=Ceratocystis fimbriata f. sp. platani TaxID=88771 RepID=A0A0F8B401_CERFI|nr:Autophagy-related protein 2 [Ceratocystis platani]